MPRGTGRRFRRGGGTIREGGCGWASGPRTVAQPSKVCRPFRLSPGPPRSDRLIRARDTGQGGGSRLVSQALNPVQGPVQEEAIVGDSANHVPIPRLQGRDPNVIGFQPTTVTASGGRSASASAKSTRAAVSVAGNE